MLNSAVVSAWLWVHVGVLLVMVGYATCARAMFPCAVERGRQRIEQRPLRTFLLGIAVSVPWLALGIGLGSAPSGVLKFAGVLLGLAWLALALVGTASIAHLIGSRGEPVSVRWTHPARGAALLTLTWMLPLLGWFIVMPLTLACGAGCMLGRGRNPVAPDVPPPSSGAAADPNGLIR